MKEIYQIFAAVRVISENGKVTKLSGVGSDHYQLVKPRCEEFGYNELSVITNKMKRYCHKNSAKIYI